MTIFRACPAIAVMLLLAACHPPQPVAGSGITGVYTLSSVDGVRIPGAVPHDGVDLHLHSGTFTIRADGTCLSRTVFTPPGGAKTTREVRSHYELDGSRLTMQWEGAGMTEGTVQGDTFVMDNHGMIFEYTRRGESSR